MSKKIGVIGEKDSVLPFKLFGFTVCFDSESLAVQEKIEEMVKEDYGVIFITETVAEKVRKTIQKYKSRLTPAIILFPGHLGSLGIGLAQIQQDVEKAVGQNILTESNLEKSSVSED
ncbi:V-type ATP synthase subunit F [Clostridia bacterium]|nr:V-type ATP synthase subunit F [Clostridia bacterium]